MRSLILAAVLLGSCVSNAPLAPSPSASQAAALGVAGSTVVPTQSLTPTALPTATVAVSATAVAATSTVAPNATPTASPVATTAPPTIAPTIPPTVAPTPVPTPTPTLAPTPTPAPTAAPCLTTVTNPAATGVQGTVQWGTQPVAGVRVELREDVGLGFDNGEVYSSATTGADGRFRLTGARTTNLKFVVTATAGYQTPFAFTHFGACGDQVVSITSNVDAGIVYMAKEMAVSPGSGSVNAGPLTIRWDPLAQTDRYCVSLYDSTTATQLTTGQCQSTPGYADVGTAVTWTTPVLVSGHRYQFTIAATAPQWRYTVGSGSATNTVR